MYIYIYSYIFIYTRKLAAFGGLCLQFEGGRTNRQTGETGMWTNKYTNGQTDKLPSLLYILIRVSQTIVVTSQTDKYLWKTTFSHSLGQMNYRNAKKKIFF